MDIVAYIVVYTGIAVTLSIFYFVFGKQLRVAVDKC